MSVSSFLSNCMSSIFFFTLKETAFHSGRIKLLPTGTELRFRFVHGVDAVLNRGA